MVRVLSAKYRDPRSLDMGKKFSAASHTWRNLLEGYKIVQDG